MILTIKRNHNLDLNTNDNVFLKEFLRQGNIVKRCSLNYFKKNPDAKLSDCEKYIKSLNNIELINASWIKSISNSIKNIDDRTNNLFGNRKLFNKLSKKEYTSEQERKSIKDAFQESRDTQVLFMRGSTSDPNTNRCGKFNLVNDVLYLDFYINKDNKFHFILDNIERNQLKDLRLLNDLIQDKKGYFNIGIDGRNVYISYDNSILIDKQTDLIEGRILSIDLNPYDIGFVVMNNKQIIEERVIKIEDLIKNRDAEKTDFELSILNKMIVETALHYKCSTIVLEKLKLKNSTVKIFNEWNVNDTRIGIQKWCDYYGIKYKEVSPYYSSFMGQYLNPFKIDSIAAAIELGRRFFINSWDLVKNRIEKFLSNEVRVDDLPNRWKKEVLNIKKYLDKKVIILKDLYSLLKTNTKKYYRVRIRFSEVASNFTESSLKSKKSLMSVFDVYGHQMT